MIEKKEYESPVLEVVYYAVEETLTGSGIDGGIGLPDHDW